MIATTSGRWKKPPKVTGVTSPNSYEVVKTTAMVCRMARRVILVHRVAYLDGVHVLVQSSAVPKNGQALP